MLVMRTTENLTDPVGELVSAQQTIGLDHLALAVDPFGFYGVQPRALLRQKATYDPHSMSVPFDLAVMSSEPSSELAAYVPGGVVPDEEQDLLADSFELLSAPSEKPGRYLTHGTTIHEPQPRLLKLRQIESVARDGLLTIGVVLGDRLLDEAHRLSLLGPATQGRRSESAPPALILEAGGPLRIGLGHAHQSVAPPFFLSYRGSGLVIHRLARCQRTLRRRAKVARIVSPETRFSIKPCSKLTSAAISRVQRLVSLPNSLGERCSNSLKVSALFSSTKTAWVLLGREEPALRASRPRSLKSWMASRTVCCPQPRFLAICGAYSPLELAKSIWLRRKVKASLERSPASKASRSSSENERTKIGGFMAITVTHTPIPTLDMH